MSRNKKRTDGRYSRQVYLGRDETGKRKYKTFYADTDRAAQKLADDFRSALGKGADPAQMDATLATLYDNLIAVKKAKGISQKSLDRYEDNKNHWGDLLSRPAADLRAADFQSVLNRLAEWHDGKPPMSHFTLSNLRSSAKAVYDLAIPEVVQYNPIVKTTCPAGADPEPREPISEEQQRWIRKKRPGGLPMRIEPFTPHQLRHTFCTLMYFAGVDVLTARDQMGHKDITVTLGIYTALDKKFKKKKINRLDTYLKKQTG